MDLQKIKETAIKEFGLNEEQSGMLADICKAIADVAIREHIPEEYFRKHFKEIFTAAFNSYQNHLKKLYNSQELKDYVCKRAKEEFLKTND